jgi:hypothetical protein
MSRRHGATWPPFETSPVAGARVLLSASEPAGAAGVSRRCPGRSWTPSRDRGRRDARSLPEAGSLALKRRPMHPYGSICLSELHGNCRPGPGGTGGNWVFIKPDTDPAETGSSSNRTPTSIRTTAATISRSCTRAPAGRVRIPRKPLGRVHRKRLDEDRPPYPRYRELDPGRLQRRWHATSYPIAAIWRPDGTPHPNPGPAVPRAVSNRSPRSVAICFQLTPSSRCSRANSTTAPPRPAREVRPRQCQGLEGIR